MLLVQSFNLVLIHALHGQLLLLQFPELLLIVDELLLVKFLQFLLALRMLIFHLMDRLLVGIFLLCLLHLQLLVSFVQFVESLGHFIFEHVASLHVRNFLLSERSFNLSWLLDHFISELFLGRSPLFHHLFGDEHNPAQLFLNLNAFRRVHLCVLHLWCLWNACLHLGRQIYASWLWFHAWPCKILVWIGQICGRCHIVVTCGRNVRLFVNSASSGRLTAGSLHLHDFKYEDVPIFACRKHKSPTFWSPQESISITVHKGFRNLVTRIASQEFWG